MDSGILLSMCIGKRITICWYLAEGFDLDNGQEPTDRIKCYLECSMPQQNRRTRVFHYHIKLLKPLKIAATNAFQLFKISSAPQRSLLMLWFLLCVGILYFLLQLESIGIRRIRFVYRIMSLEMQSSFMVT